MVELILQTAANAAYAASYMALIAVGLVLIFGVMGVINFAHGELYMLGSYSVFFFYMEQGVDFFAAVALGIGLVGLLGLLMELSLFRPLRSNPLGGLIASIGVLLCLQSAVVMGFGVRSRSVHPPEQRAVGLGIEGVSIQLARLYVIVAAVVLLGALWVFLKRSRFGWALRACAQDPDAARLQGISLDRTARLAMFIGAALAGAAGALTAPVVPTEPFMGHAVIITAFIIIIVGGIGSIGGAVIAAIVYAVVRTVVTTFWDGVTADIVGLVLMLLVLVIRPQGLFGTPDRA